MSKQLQVVAPVVVLPDATEGKIAYYYQGAILPDGLNKDRVASVLADGLVAEVDDPAAPIEDDDEQGGEQGGDGAADPEAVPDGTADEVLAWVDNDSERAQRALEAEKAGKDRSTLKAQLEKLAAPAAQS